MTYHKIFRKCTLKVMMKCLMLSFIIFPFICWSGVMDHIHEDSFRNFRYSYEGDIEPYISQLRENKTPSKPAINKYNYNYITDCKHKCPDTSLRLVFLVKSAMKHFDRRRVIRHTWGFENRFSDVEIRTIFLIGVSDNEKLQVQIHEEYEKHKDIVQMNFTDTYYNNTIKTMMGFKWATKICPFSKFYMFVDDDYYVSTKNILRYIRHPTKYPEYLTDGAGNVNNELLHRSKRQLVDFDLPDGIRFYSGYVKKASPFRNKLSKFHMSLKEYRYDQYPLYATAGAYVLSKSALIDMYYASFYTEHFRFDDVYLGILAHKVGILPYHSDYFHLFKLRYTLDNYKYVIATHGYEDSDNMLNVWNEQRDLGNA